MAGTVLCAMSTVGCCHVVSVSICDRPRMWKGDDIGFVVAQYALGFVDLLAMFSWWILYVWKPSIAATKSLPTSPKLTA